MDVITASSQLSVGDLSKVGTTRLSHLLSESLSFTGAPTGNSIKPNQ